MATKRPSTRRDAPTAGELETLLGSAAPLWRDLVAGLAAAHGPMSERWSASARTGGPALRLVRAQDDRTVVYLAPGRGGIEAGFVLGEKASRAAAASGLPARVLALIDGAPRCAAGRGVRLDVRTRAAVGHVLELAALKLAR